MSLRVVDESPRDIMIGIDAPVAEEGPMHARRIRTREVESDNRDCLRIMGGLVEDFTEAVADELAAPEL